MKRAAASADLPGGDLAQRLTVRAARRAPPPLAERLEEEWLADLATRRRTIARLQLALGCCWAVRVITQELSPLAALPGGSSVAPAALEMPRLNFVSGRTLALLAIALLHVGVFYVLASGFARHRERGRPPPSITTTVSSEHPPVNQPPPLAPPSLAPAHLQLQPPLVLPELSNPVPEVTEQPTVIDARPPPSTADLSPPIARVSGGPGRDFPNSDDFYPLAARRAGTEGVATVNVCVDPLGRLTAAPALTTSSGSRDFDTAALALANRGSGHYRPSTENGRAVSDCYGLRIHFRLRH